MIVDQQLKDDGDFYFGEKFVTPEGLIEMTVHYQHEGVRKVYLAVGDDNVDLMRDWAFEWLEIFGNQGEENVEDPDEFNSTH